MEKLTKHEHKTLSALARAQGYTLPLSEMRKEQIASGLTYRGAWRVRKRLLARGLMIEGAMDRYPWVLSLTLRGALALGITYAPSTETRGGALANVGDSAPGSR